jgi:hypothetical protein
MSFLTYEGHGSIAFNELYNEQNKQRYIRLTLADVTYFGVTYGIRLDILIMLILLAMLERL